ncbi:hypothetical protein [Hymenobacter sp. BRD67]|uniref:hypothetical protein n=1 Tax=Hymenobacter sp. BRD67 TaxID=2675877 RepID=UPI001563BFE9|nr:hypothetical protein [Hymenobacter sp. BRD67]QKG52268.1 hypothetical protein GKZ67_06110 [Hymenobacter sp. BRD67]
MTLQAIYESIDSIRSLESGFWIFKGRAYEVQTSANEFSLRRHGGGGRFSPIYPTVKGRILGGEDVRVELDIKPDYLTIAYCSILCCFLLWAFFFSGKGRIISTVSSDWVNKILALLFCTYIPSLLCYYQTIGPTQNAERLVKSKLFLKEIKT